MGEIRLKNGQRLNYEICGQGEPVLLIHGFTNYGLSWFPQITPLVYNGYQVILPDLPGHGLSSKVNEEYSLHQLALDMFELLDYLGVDKVVACGLSLGGMVVQQMAVEQSNKLKGIVIANSTPYFTSDAHKQIVQNWIGFFSQLNGPQLRLEKTWDILVHQKLRTSSYGQYIYSNWREVLEQTAGESYINIAKGMQKFDLRDQLKTITIPTQIIASVEDLLFDVSLAELMNKEIPNSRLSIIEESGHISNLDHPEAFSAVLLAFLGAL